MKRFLASAFLFSLPLVVGYVLLERRLQRIPNSYNQKKWNIEKQLSEIEVLNVGSSNALSGIDPQYFSHKGFNLANATQTIYYDEKLIEHYADKLPRLKLVIIPVDYAFHRQLAQINEQWRSYFYYYYWKIGVPDAPFYEMKKYSLLSIYSPRTVYHFIRKKFKLSLAPKYQPNGYYRRDSTAHIKWLTDSMGITRENYLSKFYSENNISQSKACLENAIKVLQAYHVEVVLISMPFFHTLYDHFDPKIVARNQAVINELCNRYHCRYFNYMKDARFGIDDFNNCDHMDYIGAAKLSSILDSEVIAPAFRN
jgi:hypothetical protein